jgi:sugar lactone lactonase YvrE
MLFCLKAFKWPPLFVWAIVCMGVLVGEVCPAIAQGDKPQRGLPGDLLGDLILGQPDFTEVAMNETSPDRVWDPGGVLVDESFDPPRMWVYDTNGRVLGVILSRPVSEASKYSASVVIGQASLNVSTCNGDSSFQSGYPAPTDSTLCAQNVRQLSITEAPSTVNMALDSRGRLYVPDQWNNRVLAYDDPWNDQVADRVWGQDGFDRGVNLPHFGCNRGENENPGPDTICFQTDIRDGSGYEGGTPGVYVDSWDNLWVADTMNHRVLRFPLGPDGYPEATADIVLGQYDFHSRDTSACMEGLDSDGDLGSYDPFMLCRPAAVLVDDMGRVYVADTGRMEAGWEGRFYGRVVVYGEGPSGWEVIAVWDGKGTWTRERPDFGRIDPRTGGLRHPSGLAFDPDGNIWVTDTGNHQIVLLDRMSGVPINVLGRSRPTWEQDPQGHMACGADQGLRYQNEIIMHWEDGSSRTEVNICDPSGNVASLSNRDVLVAAQACFQDVFLFPLSRYPGDPRRDCRDHDPSYPWYDPDCRPYIGARIFNRTQGCQRNKVTARSLGPASQRISYARALDQLFVSDNGGIKVWTDAHRIEVNWAEPESVWAGHPLRRVSGRFFEWRQPYGAVSVDGSMSRDALWLAVRDGGVQKLVLYELPLRDGIQPTAVLEPPLPVLGGGTLEWGPVPSLAGRLSLSEEGELWVVDVHNHRVFRVRNPRYRPVIDVILGQEGLEGVECNQGRGVGRPGPESLCNPGTVALDHYGNVFVADHFLENWGNGRLLEWDRRHFATDLRRALMGIPAERVFFTKGDFNRGGVFCGQLNSWGTCAPMGMAFDESGYLYVGLNPYASSENFYPRVWFNPLGDWMGPPDAALEDYQSIAMGFAADSHGNVYVLDHNRARVIRYDRPWAFQGRAEFGRACQGEETARLSLHNPHSYPMRVRLIWTMQNKLDDGWSTMEENATLAPGEIHETARSETAYDIVDATISTPDAPYRSLEVIVSNYCDTKDECLGDVPAGQWSAEYWRYGGGVPTEPQDPDSIPEEWGELRVRENATVRYGLGGSLEINFDRHGGGPNRCGVGADRFAGLFRRTVDFRRGAYTFTAGSDDGIKVWIDDGGWTVLEGCEFWNVRGFSETVCTHEFSSDGPREVAVAFFENGGAARVKLEWEAGVQPNKPPTVWAGQDRSVTPTQPVSLNGVVEDDGLPDPPGRLTINWSKRSGPGTVSFTDPSAVTTTATFSRAGTYVLRLTACDGELTAFDEVVVTVNPEPDLPPSVPSVEGPSSIRLGEMGTFRALSSDPEGGPVRYVFDWGDGDLYEVGFVPSGSPASAQHLYTAAGRYWVRVRGIDEGGKASDWSEPLGVEVEEQMRVEVVTATEANTYTHLGPTIHHLQQAQSFRAEGDRICRISVALARYGMPTDDITVSIRSHILGQDMATSVIPRDAVTSTDYRSPSWLEADFHGCVEVMHGETYYVVLTTGLMDFRGYYRIPLNTSNPYRDGNWYKGSSAMSQLSHDMLVRVQFDALSSNNTPCRAVIEKGPSTGRSGEMLTYSARASDPDGDKIRYTFDWGDGSKSTTSLVYSGSLASASHAWLNEGLYLVRVRAEDEYGAQGPWSEAAEIQVQPWDHVELVISHSPTGNWYLGSSPGRRRQAQRFKALGTSVVAVSINVMKVGEPKEPIRVSIRRTLSSQPIVSGRIEPHEVSEADRNNSGWVTVPFSAPSELRRGAGYFLVLEVPIWDDANHYRVGYERNNPYPFGMWYLGNTPRKELDMACIIRFER